MKINEVVKRTCLSKKTIYYYIEEQFITPEINTNNGYYIFKEKDVRTLQIVQKLRKTDFSIKDIHDILNHPGSIRVYIFKHLEELNRRKAILNEQIQSLSAFEKTLPMMVSDESLFPLLEEASLTDTLPCSDFSTPEGEAKLISLYLWGPFIQGIEMTEYRQYLWKKVLDETATSKNPNLTLIRQYLYDFPADQLENELAKKNIHIQKIANLAEENIDTFVENIKQNMKNLLRNSKYITYWKSHYHALFFPQTCLFDSELNTLVRELSPKFSAYYNNIHDCCGRIYDWLYSDEGTDIKELLLTVLNGYIDIEANHHADLVSFFIFPINFKYPTRSGK